MPKKKLEKGTPKALDKKVKAKGLKKLKWYVIPYGFRY
jgi:hypothetical protein